VRSCLVDPAGGAVQQDHVFPITSPNEGDRRTDAELEAALAAIDLNAQENRAAGRRQVVGRRLYLFMSGHGFSPSRQRACLFTADAQERLGYNVHATGWLAWLRTRATSASTCSGWTAA
jgi:hypothetical protein